MVSTLQSPYPVVYDGKQYQLRLKAEADEILSNLIAMLPSYYMAETPSTNYALELRAFAIELAKIRLELNDISEDGYFATTRSEFLYQVLGYLIFVKSQIPDTDFNDKEFKNFLLAIVKIYFQGSTTESIADGIELFTDRVVTITQHYLETEAGSEGYDISDQFGMTINFEISGDDVPQNFVALDNNIKILVRLIKPAHTLFNLRYIFSDDFDTINEVIDSYKFQFSDYNYDDVRKNWYGLEGEERLGVNKRVAVEGEDVSYQF